VKAVSSSRPVVLRTHRAAVLRTCEDVGQHKLGMVDSKYDAHSSIYERVHIDLRANMPVVLGHEWFAGAEIHKVDMNH
jgi:hypothetical protein